MKIRKFERSENNLSEYELDFLKKSKDYLKIYRNHFINLRNNQTYTIKDIIIARLPFQRKKLNRYRLFMDDGLIKGREFEWYSELNWVQYMRFSWIQRRCWIQKEGNVKYVIGFLFAIAIFLVKEYLKGTFG